jgi:RNA polymerase subunit RPABC4/transcription elongation factor Spt4
VSSGEPPVPPVPPPVPPVPPVAARSCPKCQSIVDVNATFCPVCGLNLRDSGRNRSNAWIVVAIIAALLIGGGLAIGLASGGSTTTKTDVVTAPAVNAPAVSVTVSTPTHTVTAPIETVTKPGETVVKTTTSPSTDTSGGGNSSP